MEYLVLILVMLAIPFVLPVALWVAVSRIRRRIGRLEQATLAVLLSIRRESLFIAVLGLFGGFATPALLSTGENRPVPLFAYLVILNVGLAWVAYRQVWPALTLLTVVLTSACQWVWVPPGRGRRNKREKGKGKVGYPLD